jgi:hypothetical protein
MIIHPTMKFIYLGYADHGLVVFRNGCRGLEGDKRRLR